MTDRHRRKFPRNHIDLTWRHPREAPTNDLDEYMGLFWDSEDEAGGYEIIPILWDGEDWQVWIGSDEELEPTLGMVAWMPMPDLPRYMGSVNGQ